MLIQMNEHYYAWLKATLSGHIIYSSTYLDYITLLNLAFSSKTYKPKSKWFCPAPKFLMENIPHVTTQQIMIHTSVLAAIPLGGLKQGFFFSFFS